MRTLKTLFASCLFALISSVAVAAPFYNNFHNVSSATFFDNFSYYPNQGMGLQTLSLYRAGNQTLAAGAFSAAVTGGWYAYGNLTTASFNERFQQLNNDGFRPRELSVMVVNGQPRFTAIWKKRAGEAYYTYINMSGADLNAKWQNLVEQQGFRVEDYVSYYINGVKKHAAIYVKDGKGFYFYMNMSKASFEQRFQQMAQEGYYPTSFNASASPQGEVYAAVWMKTTGATAMFFNMSAAGYQAKFDHYNSLGYRLHKIQGYGNGQRFAAIWKK